MIAPPVRSSGARRAPARRPQPLRSALVLCVALLAGGCSTLSSWFPASSWPSFEWPWGSSKKLGPAPEFQATVTPRIAWQTSIGKAAPGLAPAVTPAAVYAAATDGTIVRVDRDTGQAAWRISAGARLAGGVGADATLLAVGTDKGEVLAFDVDGKPKWQARVTSEVVGPPMVADGVVAVWSGDGRLYAFAAADGKTKWVYQRTNPPLIVRNLAGGIIVRGGLFTGTAGGKLVAIDAASGNVGWEGNVATPKGATELERIADITSQPLVDERQVCSIAFQGRIVCFDVLRGTLLWTRDVSSLSGIVADSRYLYLTDDKGAVQALDKTTGASVWKQDKLAKRQPSGPQLVGDFVGVVDGEGVLYVMDRGDGKLVGRLATDGTPPTERPAIAGANALWQSTAGALFAVTAQ